MKKKVIIESVIVGSGIGVVGYAVGKAFGNSAYRQKLSRYERLEYQKKQLERFHGGNDSSNSRKP